ncbi:hypothetical protein I3843_14G101700 [Carya illinoinensis]|nr:hypothetical protein I3843_14G101700 [Carya illinoinensis]
MVQVSVKKVTSLLAFLLVIMLLMMALPPASAPAPTPMKKNDNGTTFRCNNGFMEEEEEGEESCRLIANDYLDMEFMMGSGISRMLDVKPPSYPSKKALDPKGAGCGRTINGKSYTPCSSQDRKGNPPSETGSIYKRNPPKSP